MAHCSDKMKRVWRMELLRKMDELNLPVPPDLAEGGDE